MVSTYQRRELILKQVLDACFKVHTVLGPGLLESAYEKCVVHELRKIDVAVQYQKTVPIEYDGLLIETGFRLDLMVNEELIVELKAVEELHPVHFTQLLTYLKLSNLSLGLLVNFNVKSLRDGIHRVVNNHFEGML